MLLSRVLKSAESSTTTESWQLGVQPIKPKIIKNFDDSEGEQQVEKDEAIAKMNEEIAGLEAQKIELQNQLQNLEQLILVKENRMKQLDLEIENEIHQIKKQAQQDGYDQGYQQGISNANQEYEMLLENARKIIKTIENEKVKRIEASDTVIVDLSVQIARKIIRDNLSENNDEWLKLVNNAITEIKENGEIKVLVHPNQFLLTNKIRDEYETNTQINISVYPDGNLEEYQCLIETKNGLIDTSIDTQLEVLRVKLIEVVEGE